MIDNISKKYDKLILNLLIFTVYFMLFVYVLNIVFRWFEMSLEWAEALVRHTVLLSAFLGATLAIGSGGHIKIDLLSRSLEKLDRPKFKIVFNLILNIIIILVQVSLTYAALDFMEMEAEYGKTVFLGIHSSVLVGIIPFGFGLMIIRQFLSLLSDLGKLW